MAKTTSPLSGWQRWLSYSAFTLAGMALEGSTPRTVAQPQPGTGRKKH